MNEATVLHAASEIYACNEALLQPTKESVETSYKYVNLQIFDGGTHDLIEWTFGHEWDVNDVRKYWQLMFPGWRMGGRSWLNF